MLRPKLMLGCAAFALACTIAPIQQPALAADAPALVRDGRVEAGDVQLADTNSVATLYVDAAADRVVHHAAELFANDVNAVAGKRPRVSHDADALRGQPVLIGTIGKSPVIDRLIAEKKLDVADVQGKWETFVIATVDKPLPNVERALVIAGSDRRGTAYGVFEVSEQIGVSPWYWWADVTPARRESIAIKAGANVVGPPAVKYRGIFINDEDWGLEPWARKTFETEAGTIGPKTYAKVFELMLRLKANYLWPAMHECTKEFASVPSNVEAADEWGIVMGASHPEPLNRNNIWFDQSKRGPWRYDTNRENIKAYWEEWAKLRGKYEAVWTVGMRGIHDSGMQGPNDLQTRVGLLSQAITDQRELLGRYVESDVAKVPQAFIPYKEVLEQYQAGLKLPDDITLVWCDDNYGYLRQVSTPDEQKRSGSSGVYYHVSYLGRPTPYLWVDSTAPALIHEQMQTARAYGADRIWVLNVGDIKSCETGMDFWMRLAWNPDRWADQPQSRFLSEFASSAFGETLAQDIASILNDYHDLCAARKPELMHQGIFSPIAYGEAQQRAEAWKTLRSRADALEKLMPAERRDAYFELVLYRVRVGERTSSAYAGVDLARLHAAQQDAAGAERHTQLAYAAIDDLERETAHYNDAVAGGKWKNIVRMNGIERRGGYRAWDRDWFLQHNRKEGAATTATSPAREDALHVVVDGSPIALIDGKPVATNDGDVDWNVGAVSQAPAPWEVADGVVSVPNGAGTKQASTAANAITHKFTVDKAGQYTLFGQVVAPTPDDDSFFVRIDDGEWKTWNDIEPSESPAWRAQGEYELSKGEHTLSIAPREDGAGISTIRMTRRSTAERLSDGFKRSADVLPSIVEGSVRNSATFSVLGTQANVVASDNWIVVKPAERLSDRQQFVVSIDWMSAPKDVVAGEIIVSGGDAKQRLSVRGARLPDEGFGEIDGVVSMEAEHFTRDKAVGDVRWTTLPHLGRSGPAAVTVQPYTAASIEVASIAQNAPALEYDFVTITSDRDVTLHAYCLPSYRLNEGRGLRYAASIDDGEPQVVDFHESGGGAGEHGEAWNQIKSRNISVPTTTHRIGAAGKHTLRLWMVDPNVIVDKLVIDLGGLEPSELGPPETRRLATAGR